MRKLYIADDAFDIYHMRRWYNPFRWIFGKYVKIITVIRKKDDPSLHNNVRGH